jgi:hypothetical protein
VDDAAAVLNDAARPDHWQSGRRQQLLTIGRKWQNQRLEKASRARDEFSLAEHTRCAQRIFLLPK